MDALKAVSDPDSDKRKLKHCRFEQLSSCVRSPVPALFALLARLPVPPALQDAWVLDGSDSTWAALVNKLVDGVEAAHGHAEFRTHVSGVDLWQLRWQRRVLLFALPAVAATVLVVLLLVNDGSLWGWDAPFGDTCGLVTVLGAWTTVLGAVLFCWNKLATVRSSLGKPKSAHFPAETGTTGAVKCGLTAPPPLPLPVRGLSFACTVPQST